MIPSAGERVTEALVQHVSARLEHRRHLDEVFATARQEADEARQSGSRRAGLRSARRSYAALREFQFDRPSFDPAPLREAVLGGRGGDAGKVDLELYRAAWQLEFLAGVHRLAAGLDVAPLAGDELGHAAQLLAEWLLEPDDGPVHERLERAQAVWRALGRGELLAIKAGWLLLGPRRSMDRTHRREALMRLPEARRELLQEWRRILVVT